jgi:1-acyl-sn-glycerol-3-phosphate acyltransferase
VDWTSASRRTTTLLLDLLVMKPMAISVWCFSQRGNTIHFSEREAMLRRIDAAFAEGRPVLVAANHVSWFDDPVIPMALYRSGQRASLEYAALAALVAVCWALPEDILPPRTGVALCVAAVLCIGLLGSRKVWWTLGALENLSDARVLRGKFALTREAPPGPILRGLLTLADSAIPWFMRSGTVRTVFVDRRPGEDARRVSARGVAAALDVAERLEPVWVFFEGGRTKNPPEIAPARRGIGALLLGLRERGQRPLLLVVYHRGMERLIPPGGSHFLSSGHEVFVRWTEFDAEASGAVAKSDDLAVANEVREVAVRLQTAMTASEETRTA